MVERRGVTSGSVPSSHSLIGDLVPPTMTQHFTPNFEVGECSF